MKVHLNVNMYGGLSVYFFMMKKRFRVGNKHENVIRYVKVKVL